MKTITVAKFKQILEKNLGELVWRDVGWGPVPIHGKGVKGFSAEDRVRYNQKQIASGKLSKEETAKKRAVVMQLSKEFERKDIKNAYKLTRDEFASKKTAEILKYAKGLSMHKHVMYDEYANRHEKSVKSRLMAGRHVSPEVLQDYKNASWFPTLIKKK